MTTRYGVVIQPEPTGEGKPVVDMVISDLQERREFGIKKYGTELRINNGRNALLDAYQEALDLCIYLRQLIQELDEI